MEALGKLHIVAAQKVWSAWPMAIVRIKDRRFDENLRTDEPCCRTLIMYDRVARQKQHAHRFIELMRSLDGAPIIVDFDGEVVGAPCHVVAPLRSHAIIECGPVARLYIAIGLRSVAPLRYFPPVQDDDERLQKALLGLQGKSASEVSERVTLAWQCEWLPTFECAPIIEDRILRALRYIDVRKDPKTTRAKVAALVGLSPTRFAALFLQEIGMPLRRYIIWRRVLIALEYLKMGKTATQAAAYAGFSDAPHLCRCYRGTFGSPPSLLPIGGIVQHGAGLELLTQF